MRRLWLFVVASCATASHRPVEAPDEEVGTLTESEAIATGRAPDGLNDPDRAHRPLVVDGYFNAYFPGQPLAAKVRALPDRLIAADQVQVMGRVAADATASFGGIGTWEDEHGVRYLALVPSLVDPNPRRDSEAVPMEQPLWFSAGVQPDRRQPWRIWHERDGRGSVLVIEDGGTVVGVRYEAVVHRLRPLAIDPATPMVLVELGNDNGDEAPADRQVARYGIFGFQDRTVKQLLAIDAARTAVVIEKSVVRATVLPDETECSTTELVATGCTVRRIDYTWAHGRFTGAARAIQMRLVDAVTPGSP